MTISPFAKRTLTTSKFIFIQKLCWFRFKKEISYEYERVDCRKPAVRKLSRIALLPCYPQGHPITDAKFKDLLSLFSMKPAAISRVYFDFYSNLQDHD
ncbi:hypothetical protein PR048_032927 [Dryococelus australis]|uniref:Uncharacterized protein n=1 Tax=Dryococelus australis TaxID=614101 RepID=A0ABQ9G3M3_9NEOP|nr:hypothetical protein PR048_032927 [Dryococelus australis]